jgi:UMF1 family MFS transporter
MSNSSALRVALAPGVRLREVWAWAMYDFANSGYTTVVITAIFNAYFVAVVAGNAPWATFAWTLTLAVSYALILVTAPLIGAAADRYACKKVLLGWATVGCVLCTAALALAGSGDIALAVVCLIAGNFFFGSGENLIAAFLPELAREEALGKVSGWGWGLGYVGGIVTLGLCLAYVMHAQARGEPAEHYVAISLLITAAMFAIAAVPTFLLLVERARPQPGHGRGALVEAMTRLAGTIAQAQRYRDLNRFLACVLFYQAGVQTVIALAAIYAQQAMHFTTEQTITLILVVNVAAALGAVMFGHLQDRLGHKRALACILAGWIVMVVIAAAARDLPTFWVAANLGGLCLGSSQSAARALVGYLSPADRRAEFFGLWGLSVKLSSILGPVTYGALVWLTQGSHRAAFLATGVYFAVGLALLAGVDVARGRQAAAGREPDEQMG